jgi:hypothetical protein
MNWTSAMPMRLVGDRFELVPAQSAFGCLVRLARLNQMAPTDFRSFFGLYARRSDDIHHLLATSPRRRQGLATALKLDLPDTWDPSVWNPYREHQVVQAGSTLFRYCIACIRVGYHCQLHQLPWIARCPWHGVGLRTGCPRCGGALATSTGAGRKLLTCSCGMDLLNESAAARLGKPVEGAVAYLDQYLTWAQKLRVSQVLIGAPPQAPSVDALQQLVQLPEVLRSTSSRSLHKLPRTYQRGLPPEELSPVEDARRLMALRDAIPRMLHLPGFTVKSCDEVVQEVARSLPPNSLSPRERALFLGRTSDEADAANRETSAVVISLPPLSMGADHFLNLQSVHPVCARFLVHLEDAYEAAVPGLKHGPSQALTLLRRTQRDILSRHYAEGLRAILARHVHELYSNQRRKLQLTAPLALIRFDGKPSIRVAFTRMNPYEDPNDVLAASAGLR